MNAVLPNRPNGISTNPHKVVSQNEEGKQDNDPGKQQHDDLDEILKEADIAHQPCDGFKDRSSGIQSDLCDPSGLQQFGGRKPCTAGFQAKPCKALENDPGETIPVADDISKGTDEQSLLDEPCDNVIAFTHAPEERSQRHVDHDERGRNEGNLALQQAKAAIDIAGEDLQEAVNDAGAAHISGSRPATALS
jgi:hypothetical protein